MRPEIDLIEGWNVEEMTQEQAAASVVTRRRFLEVSGAALAAVAATAPAAAQQGQEKTPRSADHHLPNEQQFGSNAALDAENPSAVWGVETDSGTIPPFKYPFSMARKRIESGGWTRQVTARELPVSKTMAGVEMRLVASGVREL